MDDDELLHLYARDGSEPAFRELVQRHLAVVHGSVLRQVQGDAHLAADVVQRVFVAFARKAPALPRQTVVIGWLYTAARLEAARAIRTEVRRRERDAAAQAMSVSEAHATPDQLDWEELSPLLDSAMAQLNAAEREAVLLRFFSGRSFAEIGSVLQLTEDSARKRVDRAIEKLRQYLRRRGIVSSATALGTVISGHAAVMPGPGLVEALASHAWVHLSLPSATTTGILMSTNKLGLGIVSGLLLLTAGVVLYDRADLRERARTEVALQHDVSTARKHSAELNVGLAATRQQVAEANARRAPAPASTLPSPVARRVYLSDPEYQRTAIASSLARRHLEFQRLYRRLGLSAEQIDRFEVTIAIQDQANLDASVARENGGDPQAIFKQSGPDWSSAMKGLLGQAGFQQLQDYLKTMPVREFIDSLAGPAAAIGVPLTLDQSDRLATVALAHDAMYRGGKGTDPGTVSWDEVWTPAERILSPEQLTLFQAIVQTWQQQRELQRKLTALRPSPG